jgi:hypothetical protein
MNQCDESIKEFDIFFHRNDFNPVDQIDATMRPDMKSHNALQSYYDDN